MGSIRVRPDTNHLMFDFRYQGIRCREITRLIDSPANRTKLEKVLRRIEHEIHRDIFQYERYFPNSQLADKFSNQTINNVSSIHRDMIAALDNIPSFEDFTETWFLENEVCWRKSHVRTQKDIIYGHLVPAFGLRPTNEITKADLLNFRAELVRNPGRRAKTLSNKRINAIMSPLRQILNEAADRYGFQTPFRNIKPLKIQKTDVEPFSLDEVSTLLATVRSDFRSYYTLRFFTGLRTGEVDGLKWKYIDFDNRLILVRETIVNGMEDYTKNDGSQRDIQMPQVVYDALKAQEKVSRKRSRYVFCNQLGEPLDHNNVTKRVWYPLLRHLGLTKRRPYQTRHTAATLWLASGENPEWIARQMGHTTTEMLFRVYSRFVPNLTRRDGAAFEKLLANRLNVTHI